MKHPLSEQEQLTGTVTLVLLAEQAEAIERLIEPTGACLSPPATVGGEGPIRCITLIG